MSVRYKKVLRVAVLACMFNDRFYRSFTRSWVRSFLRRTIYFFKQIPKATVCLPIAQLVSSLDIERSCEMHRSSSISSPAQCPGPASAGLSQDAHELTISNVSDADQTAMLKRLVPFESRLPRNGFGVWDREWADIFHSSFVLDGSDDAWGDNSSVVFIN